MLLALWFVVVVVVVIGVCASPAARRGVWRGGEVWCGEGRRGGGLYGRRAGIEYCGGNGRLGSRGFCWFACPSDRTSGDDEQLAKGEKKMNWVAFHYGFHGGNTWFHPTLTIQFFFLGIFSFIMWFFLCEGFNMNQFIFYWNRKETHVRKIDYFFSIFSRN